MTRDKRTDILGPGGQSAGMKGAGGDRQSAESSYMGFHRDIDSDIDVNVSTTAANGAPLIVTPHDTSLQPASPSRCSSEPYLKRKVCTPSRLASWESLEPPDAGLLQEHYPLVSSPALKCSLESQTCAVATNTPSEPRQGSSCSAAAPDVAVVVAKRGSEDSGLDSTNRQPPNCVSAEISGHRPSTPAPTDPHGLHLDILPIAPVGSYTSISLSTGSPGKDPQRRVAQHQLENDSLVGMLSCMYAKLLIVMGICFPLAEVISKQISVSYYEGFYLYLYLGSIAFLFFVYVFLLRPDPVTVQKTKPGRLTSLLCSFLKTEDVDRRRNKKVKLRPYPSKKKVDDVTHCGSFYLRLGAVAFGIGTMVYSGLEFGQFFELEASSQCYNVLHGLAPTCRMVFTFIQMYFIFINSRVAINKYRAIAKFGLMHMIATNLCVWLHVLVQETKHGIMTLVNSNVTTVIPALVLHAEKDDEDDLSSVFRGIERMANHSRAERSVVGGVPSIHKCRRSNIMGELVQEASHFLFPCIIEYSLICAAILYMMWKNIGGASPSGGSTSHSPSIRSTTPVVQRHRHHYQVDCARANKGLFTGILVLVLSIISIILFYVSIGKPGYKQFAVFGARVVELVLYLVTSLAVVVALFQVRELRFNPQRNVELDNILLIVAQSGLYLFTMFSVIGGHFATDDNKALVFFSSLACLVQATLQTIFVLDASRRSAYSEDQVRRKPGREVVTFLLLCNFAMWSISTLETQRTDSNPVQLQFYGFWAWTIITHVTTPLAIYFRFHSTVCLCDIWKRTYKLKSDFL